VQIVVIKGILGFLVTESEGENPFSCDSFGQFVSESDQNCHHNSLLSHDSLLMLFHWQIVVGARPDGRIE